MTYEVVITHETDAWLADVPSVDGAHTYARTLGGLIKSVREVIILMDDLDDSASVEMTYRFDVDDADVIAAGDLLREREELGRQEHLLIAKTAQVLDRLTKSGYSVRDAAVMVGVSPGRVSQITKKATQAKSRVKV